MHKVNNPYLQGLYPIFGLIGLFLAVFLLVGLLAALGVIEFGWLLLAASPLGLFTLIVVIAWLWSLRRVGLMRNFLESDRPTVRWTYTDAEWRQMREQAWKEAKADLNMPPGCLAFLFGLVGLMVSGAIAAGDTSFYDFEDVLEVGVRALGGLLLGGLIGGTIGLVVATGNWLSARQAYRDETPGEVAFSLSEFYALGQYFRCDNSNSYLTSAKLQPGHPALLTLIFHPFRFRQSEETWEVAVPERMQPQVEVFLHQITTTLNSDL